MNYRKTTALLVLGFTTILTQLIFFREFLNIFQGNELILGVIICIWMLSTATGSRLTKAVKTELTDHNIAWYFIVHALLTCFTILPLLYVDSFFSAPGVIKGFAEAFILCLGLLTPYCLLSGFIYNTLLLHISLHSKINPASFAFGWESLGSVVAGIMFTFGFYLLETFLVISLIMMADLMQFFILYPKTEKTSWQKYIPILIITLVIPVNSIIFKVLPNVQRPVYHKYTPYGKITVTQTDGQFNVFENGNLFFSSDNKRMAEEAVHFAVLQRCNISSVLIVSGGVSDMTNEVKKYNSVDIIDYVEINPWLINAELRFSEKGIPESVNVISKDARVWIAESGFRYDAIILALPDPVNAQLNRYYTKEFFKQVIGALNTGGVFEIALNSTANYMSDLEAEINGALYYTLKAVFPEVIVIQGERNYFMASKKPLYLNIAERSTLAGITNEFVNDYYFDDDLLQSNFNTIKGQIESKSRINLDLKPFAYMSQIGLWLDKSAGYQKQSLLVVSILLVFFTVWFLLRNSVNIYNLGIFTSAFTGASSEFLLIVLFQIHFGYIYSTMGLIIGLYMAGLTAGSLIRIRQFKNTYYLYSQVILMILVLFIPAISLFLSTGFHSAVPLKLSIFGLVAIIALFSGINYNLASTGKVNLIKSNTEKLYSIDLAGASTGTVWISLIGLPVLGLTLSCIITALLMTASIVIYGFSGRKNENLSLF